MQRWALRSLLFGFAVAACGGATVRESGPYTSVIANPRRGPVEPGLRFETLDRWVHEGGVRTVPELLARLPVSFRSHPVLMFRSRSVQTGTPDAPRAILFTDDGRFVLSFNGDPSEAGYSSVETLSYGESGSFRLQEISFSEGGDAPAVVSEVNPPQCLKCHGSPPRPIWDTYPLWPGAYGEHEQSALEGGERAAYTSFLEKQKGSRRYGLLSGLEAPLTPRTRAEAEAYEGGGRLSPNATLGVLLQRLQYRAIAARLAATPRFGEYALPLVAAVALGCRGEELEALLPAEAGQALLSELSSFETATKEESARGATLKRARLVFGGDVSHPHHGEQLSPFRFLVERGLGVPTDNWAISLEERTFDFATGRPVLGDLAAALRDEAVRRGMKRDQFVLPASSESACAKLAPRARALIHGPLQSATFLAQARAASASLPSGAPALLSTCISCHDSSDRKSVVGPRIPFGEPDLLRTAMRTGRYRHGSLVEEIGFRFTSEAAAERMPMTTFAADGEGRGLLEYLRAVAAGGE